jgi:hypothetical protein
MTKYKFLRTGLKSDSGNVSWKIGQWQKVTSKLDICHVGLHCSKGIYQAFSYVQGEILAKVETKGKSIIKKDKEAWSEMRIIKCWKWQKKDSVMFAIYAARLVLKYFEKEHPDNKQPRQAIEAAEAWIKDPTDKNAAAASAAASYAYAYASAAYASAAASYAAASYAYASYAYASAASYAAAAASAASYASASVRVNLLKKIDKWMLDHLKELKEITK